MIGIYHKLQIKKNVEKYSSVFNYTNIGSTENISWNIYFLKYLA